MGRRRVVDKLPEFVARQQQRAAKVALEVVILGAGEAAAMTPRASSVLLNSQTRSVRQDGTRIIGTAGYTAEYALAVHEAPGKLKGLNIPRPDGQGVYWGPSGEPEFLRKGFERARPEIDRRIKAALKVGR